MKLLYEICLECNKRHFDEIRGSFSEELFNSNWKKYATIWCPVLEATMEIDGSYSWTSKRKTEKGNERIMSRCPYILEQVLEGQSNETECMQKV